MPDNNYVDPRLVPAEQLSKENGALTHAIQTGVALTIEAGGNETTPKHLRVATNVAMCEAAAIVKILVFKGIIKDINEYLVVLNGVLEAEKSRYEYELSTRLCQPVKLA